MKKAILLIQTLVFSTSLIAQESTVVKFLMQVSDCADYSCFVESAKKAGFIYYYKTNIDSLGKCMTFQVNRFNEDKTGFFSFALHSSLKNSTKYSTVAMSSYIYNKLFFDKAKDEAKNMGFISVGKQKDKENNSVLTKYVSTLYPAYHLYFKTRNDENNGIKQTCHILEIQRIK